MVAHSPNYDRFPYISISSVDNDCAAGWGEIAHFIQNDSAFNEARVIVIECYPGVNTDAVTVGFSSIFRPETRLISKAAFLSETDLYEKFKLDLGDDPVFAMMGRHEIKDFFDPYKLECLRQFCADLRGKILVVGVGATLIVDQPDILIYVDLARWEIQKRQREHVIGNLGLTNKDAAPSQLYRRSFFLDWRAADRLKQRVFGNIDFFLDANVEDEPKMISGEVFRNALRSAVQRPFRVVPFFDPGPWGGQWMKEQFGLPENGLNYAWCFDCVPEENSLLLGFGERRIEIPAINLILFQPVELLGEDIFRKFGAEFPIRFDYLDTVRGGNLSLQVHPLRDYIRRNFGMAYTQDESYYMFEAEPDATVYLGLQNGVNRSEFERELRLAQLDATAQFPTEKYVNVWPAKRHDHFLIPAGTVHCSGRNGVVLEISATPYIFTFKLWDWGRVGLDGKPRPIHLAHGLANIQWDRTADWVRSNLINYVENVAEGDGWKQERTGLHQLEFIETQRHWFTKSTPHNTHGTVNVLNLVQGDVAIVESPVRSFAPFEVHYGETFIVPAAVGAYTIRPKRFDSQLYASMKASVRKIACEACGCGTEYNTLSGSGSKQHTQKG